MGFMAAYGKLLDACLRTNNLKCAEKIVMLLGATSMFVYYCVSKPCEHVAGPPSLNAQPQPTHPQGISKNCTQQPGDM